MKGMKVKQVLSREVTSGRGKSEGGQIWSMYFVFVYENRTVKPIEIVLKKGEGEVRENDGGGESS
jgi:hypothetical protein